MTQEVFSTVAYHYCYVVVTLKSPKTNHSDPYAEPHEDHCNSNTEPRPYFRHVSGVTFQQAVQVLRGHSRPARAAVAAANLGLEQLKGKVGKQSGIGAFACPEGVVANRTNTTAAKRVPALAARLGERVAAEENSDTFQGRKA